MQTLITLNLWNNQIESQGAEHLSNALIINRVTSVSSISQNIIIHISLTQTLTTLNLEDNQIRDLGTKHLGKALRINKVM